MEIVVRGDGIAASGCAHLLAQAGLAVTAQRAVRPGVPAILVSARTQRLIGDVFQRDDLFRGLTRVEARIVAWGAGSPRRVEHSAVVVSERELLDRLAVAGAGRDPAREPAWTVFASRPLPECAGERAFGSRVAAVHAVSLAEQSSACWIESLRGGWLFLLPGAGKKGWLLAVGGDHESLLSESRLVARQIQNVDHSAGEFPAYPAMTVPCCGTNWLACGSAALAFDPLCGDGAGNAIREAILAAAVIRAAESGESAEDLIEHYRSRLLGGFHRHLQICRNFYNAGRDGPWWDAELELLQQGIDYCQRETENASPFRYQLQGFELCAV